VNPRLALTAVGGVMLWLAGGCGAAPLDVVSGPTGRLPEGLIAHWPLDEGSGSLAADRSGNGHDGQVTGGTWITGARFGGGLRLSAGDYVTVADFPPPTPSWTVSAWIQMSAEQLAMDNDTWVAIVGAENFFAGGWQLNIDNRLPVPRFDFAYWAPPLSAYVFAECDCIRIGRWIHLAAVVDVAANRVTLYVDGVVGDEETRPSDIPPGDSTLYFGRWNMNGRQLAADLDDIAIWNRALTGSEVMALVAQPPQAR
jgi:hypothetical protein